MSNNKQSVKQKIFMKQIIRMIIGIPLCVVPMFLATFIWLFDDKITWKESVGKYTWLIASGDWSKLPD